MRGRPAARELRRALDRRRGLLAGGLTAAAVATALPLLVPDAAPAVVVLAAARDLPGGTELTGDDLREVRLPAQVAPDGVLSARAELAGRVLAGPVRAGEPITDVRLVGPALVATPGHLAVPVRVAEPALPLLVRPGDRVDVLATALEGGRPARTLVHDVAVLAVPEASAAAEGALLVLAASPAAAARLAEAAVSSRLTVAVRPG